MHLILIKMDRNTIIGFLLIFLILIGWNKFFFEPYVQQENAKKALKDSLSVVTQASNPSVTPSESIKPDTSLNHTSINNAVADSLIQNIQNYTLKNELVSFNLSNQGAKIISAELNKYFKVLTDENNVESKIPLQFYASKNNVFNYKLPINGQIIETKNIVFGVNKSSDKEIEFESILTSGAKVIIKYFLSPDNYQLDHSISVTGANLDNNVKIHWENYLERIEKNTEYEKFYSSVYFHEKDKKTDYCSCRGDDVKELNNKTVSWVSHSHQFFNNTLMSDVGFKNARNETVMLQSNAKEMKILKSDLEIDKDLMSNQEFKMKWYIGPNENNRLAAFNNKFEDIIPYGWSVFGTINKYLIRNLFLFLENFIGSKGIIILLMTLLVKLLVFPLAYKMIQSQAKMSALKPEIDKIKNKYKDDMQKQQMETMKIYNEFGVNPLGGCFPLVLQMPIWIALYRFFPATIEFRQESFLWATDLTSYDVIMNLPFSIPFFGDTLSLFAFLWMLSTLAFTYYSSKAMDFSANPAMLYMQYLMPFIFWFMFNKTAAGLTCYMFFSNLLNIAQTILGKKYLFDQDKIRAALEVNKSKPKKQSGFSARFQEMVKEQQRIQQERQNKK